MPNQSIYKALLACFEQNRGKWRKIAVASNTSYNSITRFTQGLTPNPKLDRVQKWLDYFGFRLTQ